MKWYKLTGERFGKLVVMKSGPSKPTYDRQGKKTGTRKYWECKCDCGKTTHVISASLISGKTRSCGCLRSEVGKVRLRENHPNWKGGTHIRDCKGGQYRFVLAKEHPNARGFGYIAEHRLVMSKHLGRPLKETEIVHHINGNTLDNRVQNLELWSHSHPPGQRVKDKIKWCETFLSEYAPEKLSKTTQHDPKS